MTTTLRNEDKTAIPSSSIAILIVGTDDDDDDAKGKAIREGEGDTKKGGLSCLGFVVLLYVPLKNEYNINRKVSRLMGFLFFVAVVVVSLIGR